MHETHSNIKSFDRISRSPSGLLLFFFLISATHLFLKPIQRFLIFLQICKKCQHTILFTIWHYRMEVKGVSINFFDYVFISYLFPSNNEKREEKIDTILWIISFSLNAYRVFVVNRQHPWDDRYGGAQLSILSHIITKYSVCEIFQYFLHI